jgi:hexosaminidase
MMMRIVGAMILLTTFVNAGTGVDANGATAINVLPLPASVQVHGGKLKLDGSFTVATDGYSDARLERAIARLQHRLRRRTGIVLALGVAPSGNPAALKIGVKEAGATYPKFGEDESYALEIAGDHATLSANTVVGAMRGMETLSQLVAGDADGYYFPIVSIQDKPRFPWRGLMIDVGRHFEPVEVIQRNLDAMAAVKMNIFHWHLSDDQGFRVESKKYPKLQEKGSNGLYYTQEQVRGVIEYAADRGVRVVPEFDMPGHTSSWMVGYPELASAPGPYELETRWGVFDPTMDPTREETYEFLDGFIGEMAALFPDEYFHIGGDENNGKQWKDNPQIQEFMRAHGYHNTAELQTYFSQRVMKIVQKYGKKMVGWDEILTPNLPKDAIVQSWRGYKSLDQSAREGYNAIWSTNYYLDHMGPAEYHYLSDPLPADAKLSKEQASHVVGGEVCAWSEFLSPENIDSRIWPRTAAVAERFWSPQNVNNVADMYRRLDVVSVWLEQAGSEHLLSANRMLRQVSGTAELGPLGTLGNISSPEGVGTREQMNHHGTPSTQAIPLVMLTDAVAPDPPFRRRFAAQVDQLLSDAPKFGAGSEDLTKTFQQWHDLLPAFAAMSVKASVLLNASGRVLQLQKLGSAGLEALNYLHTGTTPSADWKEAQLALIQQAETPDASLLKLPWLGSYRVLILAAADVGSLQKTDRKEWKQKVLNEAAKQEPAQKYTW